MLVQGVSFVPAAGGVRRAEGAARQAAPDRLCGGPLRCPLRLGITVTAHHLPLAEGTLLVVAAWVVEQAADRVAVPAGHVLGLPGVAEGLAPVGEPRESLVSDPVAGVLLRIREGLRPVLAHPLGEHADQVVPLAAAHLTSVRAAAASPW